MHDFWPACGWRHLRRDDDGRLLPTDDWLRHWLARPELALVAESCAAERALHQALQDAPSRPIGAAELGARLAAISDIDARQNYRLFLALRDGLLAAPSIEAYYVGLFRAEPVALPPLFIDLIVQTILRDLLDTGADAFEARAAELLFRPQQVALQQGRLLAGDRATLDRLVEGGGFGALGRLLAEAGAMLRSAELAVLGDDNQADYWHDGERHRFLLDLTPSVAKTLAPGVAVPLALARSGLAALARVLERWVDRLLGVAVTITPQARIDDPDWRWHIGLDAESSVLLNDLYRGEAVGDDRLQRLVGLFRLDFADRADMRAELAGAPVWLGLATAADGALRLKPQNLLRNLPLAQSC